MIRYPILLFLAVKIISIASGDGHVRCKERSSEEGSAEDGPCSDQSYVGSRSNMGLVASLRVPGLSSPRLKCEFVPVRSGRKVSNRRADQSSEEVESELAQRTNEDDKKEHHNNDQHKREADSIETDKKDTEAGKEDAHKDQISVEYEDDVSYADGGGYRDNESYEDDRYYEESIDMSHPNDKSNDSPARHSSKHSSP